MNSIAHRKLWFAISGILFVASLAALMVWGLKLGIDFTGGSILEMHFQDSRPEITEISQVVHDAGQEEVVVQPVGEKDVFIRTKSLDEPTHQNVLTALKKWKVEQVSFESIGPTIGAELQKKSVSAIILVLLAIIVYVAIAFRKVSAPVSSWKYGVCAVVALFHDVLIPTGIFAVLGHFFGYEIDTLFVTAILTVLGFSVHDTIVVFDRIRENLIKHNGKNFEETVNTSVNETIARSINTSLTALLVLLAIYFFGGTSTKNFVLVLIIGVLFGTYSSIFIASPLLVSWHQFSTRKK